ncbi:hypothetical protein [Streptomyces alkaliphilus]|uniref:hypothetical protein n=1 Tax=Streptomyces alkaliphilus TaxID=1472722 RepID=UPI0011808EEB|nr:hypothetical protein [Streptomyces alkaliphilus]MQS06008.1 hypothetical protein [Streptomyces alkaliphilus]
MTTNTDRPRRDRGPHELRMVVLLLVLTVGLLITAAAVYLALAHPTLTGPLGLGAAILTALACTTGTLVHAVRQQR